MSKKPKKSVRSELSIRGENHKPKLLILSPKPIKVDPLGFDVTFEHDVETAEIAYVLEGKILDFDLILIDNIDPAFRMLSSKIADYKYKNMYDARIKKGIISGSVNKNDGSCVLYKNEGHFCGIIEADAFYFWDVRRFREMSRVGRFANRYCRINT